MSARQLETYLPVRKVAELWSCSVRHVYDLINAGQLPAVDISGPGRRTKLRVPESAITEFAKKAAIR